jgi:hypothetical protein
MTGSLTLTANTDGSITVLFPAATINSAAQPIQYQIYIALGTVTSTVLFSSSSNIVRIVYDSGLSTTSTNVFTLADQATYLVSGSTYSVGVKAVSAQNIQSASGLYNTVTAIASGNLYAGFNTLYNNYFASAGTINTKLGTPAGASVSADIAAVKSDTSTINSPSFISSIVTAVITDPRFLTVAKFLGLK